MKPKKITIMSMEMEEWINKSCTAHFGVGDDWATVYYIHSTERGKGHATELLTAAKEYYKGKRVGGTVALNPAMKHLYKKLGYEEYE